MSICCSNFYPTEMPDMREHIQEGIKRASELMRDRKTLEMINRQHEVSSISYSGSLFFDATGRISEKGSYKFAVEYRSFNGKEHVRCMN